MSSLWNLVDHFYITTYEGSSRIESLREKLIDWKIPPEKITWNIPKKLHCDNCCLASATKNHIEVYTLAKERGHKNIIVLEDDIIVYDHAVTIPIMSEKTEYFIKNYPDYDILYYGYFPFFIEKTLDDDIVKMYGLLQHAYLINEKFYSKFITLDSALLCDIIFTPMRTPIDGATLNLQVKYQKSYGVYPQLVYQDNSPFLKKGNTNAKVSKIVCDAATEFCYNFDIILIFLIIYISIKNMPH
jgi:GR25 family glycosyltransferase involved in LPS biosynthesis